MLDHPLLQYAWYLHILIVLRFCLGSVVRLADHPYNLDGFFMWHSFILGLLSILSTLYAGNRKWIKKGLIDSKQKPLNLLRGFSIKVEIYFCLKPIDKLTWKPFEVISGELSTFDRSDKP